MQKRLAIFFTLFFCLFSVGFAQTSDKVQIVFIGNSITQGARLAHPETEGPAPQTADILRADGIDVSYVNRGLSGTTTYDWLPDSKSRCFSPLIEATDAFFTPGAEHVFSVMLGTNDSAETTCNGAPVSPEQYDLNMRAIIDTLLTRYDGARIVVNYPIWYSPSTYNGAKYLQSGLDRLQTYHPVITQLAAAYPNRVFLGDNNAFAAFENHPELFDEEQGNAGKFYLHPNPEGARLLAGFWANGIKKALAKPVAYPLALDPGAETDVKASYAQFRIVDADTGEPIIGAYVLDAKGRFLEMSDYDGRVGRHDGQITVSMLSYESQKVNGTTQMDVVALKQKPW